MYHRADDSVIALVLAAGSSKRFGSDKRMAQLADGSPVLTATLRIAQQAFHRVCVVLRPTDDPLTLAIPKGVEIIVCTDAEAGMAHSLAAGIRDLRDLSGTAIAVLLGDMPWIKPDTLRLLSAQASAEHIVYPSHQGRRGHPVLFGKNFWPGLLELEGDTGAKVLIEKNPAVCRAVLVDDFGVLLDIDVPETIPIST